MKIPNHIKRKMHLAAKHFQTGAALMVEIDAWFEKQGLDVDRLRCGDGCSLEEIEYGNDITDLICAQFEEAEVEPTRGTCTTTGHPCCGCAPVCGSEKGR